VIVMTTAPGRACVAELFLGDEGDGGRIAADPIYLDVSVPPAGERRCRSSDAATAFAFVFAGAGKFCNASGPLAVPTEGVGWADK